MDDRYRVKIDLNQAVVGLMRSTGSVWDIQRVIEWLKQQGSEPVSPDIWIVGPEVLADLPAGSILAQEKLP